MKLSRKIGAVIAVMFMLTACDLPFIGTSNQGPTPVPTPNTQNPDGTALAFLDAWTKGNYEGMYSLITPISQTEHTLDDFTNTYTSASTTMTLRGLTATPNSTLSPNGTSAQVSFHVVYDTLMLGNIERDLTMQLHMIDGQ